MNPVQILESAIGIIGLLVTALLSLQVWIMSEMRSDLKSFREEQRRKDEIRAEEDRDRDQRIDSLSGELNVLKGNHEARTKTFAHC